MTEFQEVQSNPANQTAREQAIQRAFDADPRVAERREYPPNQENLRTYLRGTQQDYAADIERERRDQVEAAAPADTLTPAEIAKLRHIMSSFFAHDNPPEVEIAAGSEGYSPFSNSPVVRVYDDGTASSADGMRFPRQAIRKAL